MASFHQSGWRWIIRRQARRARDKLIRGRRVKPFYAFGVHWRQTSRAKSGFSPITGEGRANHVVVSRGEVDGDNFRPADNNPGVRLFLQLDIDVFPLRPGRFVAVNGRVDDSMVKYRPVS